MIKVNTTISLDEKVKNEFIKKQWIDFKFRDEYWFIKDKSDDLMIIKKKIIEWVGKSKNYDSVDELFNDIKKNEVKY